MENYGSFSIIQVHIGQEVYGGHIICDIIEEEHKYLVYIQKNKEVLPWKEFNKNMAITVEFNLEY